MQISLDYYRILGVPIQAESHLIQQAYEDRIQQLPHHSYTEYAIESRKGLVTKAYQILSDDTSRLDYESSFFQNQQESPTGEVFREVSLNLQNNLLMGALIILLDLGEYELILRLAKPYLADKNLAEQLTDSTEEISLLWQDLVLTVVLAHLELTREEWHENQYDSAADSLEESHQLLVEEELFFTIRKEIKQDLGKLRPYQILELFTQHPEDTKRRNKGISLVKEMLDIRGGIENPEIDESGLNVERFLRFIQQIRVYLTCEEQQEIFEVEAQRPSSAAAYLAAFAYIARGVTQKKPELIVKAKNHLISLTLQQDVHLEQSICALLLAQTTEAEFSVTQSKEQDVIDYIKGISQDSPDLLPGLYLYAEKWLQTEIFPQFRDLQNYSLSLKEYFSDESVQNYLDNLSLTLKEDPEYNYADLDLTNLEMDYPESLLSISPEIETSETESSKNITEHDILDELADIDDNESPNLFLVNTTNDEKETDSLNTENVSTMEISEDKSLSDSDIPISPVTDVPSEKNKPSITAQPQRRKSQPRKSVKQKSGNTGFSKIWAIIPILLIALAVWYFWSKSAKSNEKLEIYLSEPIINLPPKPDIVTPPNPTNNAEGKLDTNTGLILINKWLEAKKEATGANYNFSKLNQILTEPQLSLWIGSGKILQKQKAYRRYEHEVKIISAGVNPLNSSQGKIQAQVKEKSQYYVNGTLRSKLSYEDDLVVDYQFIKKGNKWLIKDIKVVKNNG